jgi:PAS domain S-box-containing protein
VSVSPSPPARLSADLLRRCLAQVRHGITIADARRPDLPLIYVNEAFERLTGYRPSELLGRNCRILQGKRRQPAQNALRAALQAHTPCRAQLRNLRKDGTPFWNDLSLTPVFDRRGRLTHYIGVQEDVTDTLRSRRQLLHYQRRLRALARQLIETEEKERRRLACDLHDHLAQTLTACRIQLGELSHQLGPGSAHPALQLASAQVERALEEARGLLFELSPPLVRELGLAPALQWLGEEIATRHQIAVEVRADTPSAGIPAELVNFIFRSARELLVNATKHARPSRLHLRLLLRGNTLTLHVEDDGQASPDRTRTAPPPRRGTGFGLFSIRDRALQLGGTLTLRRRRPTGTLATLRLPLPPPRPPPRAR